MSSSNPDDSRRREREEEETTTKAKVEEIEETDNHNNEYKRQKLLNQSTNSENGGNTNAVVPATRKGSAFPMRHPADVKLHSNDFNFDDYAKKVAEKKKREQEEQETQQDAAAATTTTTASNSNKNNNKKVNEELTNEAAQKHLDRQGEAWDLHYTRSQNNFFPIKNYLAQAFRRVILPLLPPIENPEGCNDLEDSTIKDSTTTTTEEEQAKSDNNNGNDDTQQKEEEQQPKQNEIKPSFIIECGCGTGSALLPLMLAAGNIHTYAGFDISKTAVELFRKHEIVQKLTEERQKLGQEPPPLFVLDAAEEEIPSDKIPQNSADICLLIFVLSAIDRTKMPFCLKRLAGVMKSGAHLCFRDYGILDNSYFRFEKNGNKTCKGSFVKGDSTQQYFFSLEEATELFDECGFDVVDLTYHCNKMTNRKTGVEMHKIIVNGLFKKR